MVNVNVSEYKLFPAKISNVHYRHKTWEKEPNGPSALPPLKSQRQLYMQGVYDNNIIPGKVISANSVLLLSFSVKMRNLVPRVVVRTFFGRL